MAFELEDFESARVAGRGRGAQGDTTRDDARKSRNRNPQSERSPESVAAADRLPLAVLFATQRPAALKIFRGLGMRASTREGATFHREAA
jgi:hypothetical protein